MSGIGVSNGEGDGNSGGDDQKHHNTGLHIHLHHHRHRGVYGGEIHVHHDALHQTFPPKSTCCSTCALFEICQEQRILFLEELDRDRGWMDADMAEEGALTQICN